MLASSTSPFLFVGMVMVASNKWAVATRSPTLKISILHWCGPYSSSIQTCNDKPLRKSLIAVAPPSPAPFSPISVFHYLVLYLLAGIGTISFSRSLSSQRVPCSSVAKAMTMMMTTAIGDDDDDEDGDGDDDDDEDDEDDDDDGR